MSRSTTVRERDSYRRIWNTVCRIPRGKVATYGQVALLSGFPRQGRLAGYALHNLPHSAEVPWYRVINARGRISFPNGSPASHKQRMLLEREGVIFDNDSVDLRRYRWKGPRSSKQKS